MVAVPWHHAMYIRHGGAFWNELFGDNHWRRMVLGRHGDRGTFEYFLRELGYGACALGGAGAGGAGRRWPCARSRRTCAGRRCYWLGAIWFVAAYAVVSLSMTKFHHYILPAIPGLAIVIGCFLDDLLERAATPGAAAPGGPGGPAAAGCWWSQDLVDAKNAAQRFLWLFSYDYVHSPRGPPLARRARLPPRR